MKFLHVFLAISILSSAALAQEASDGSYWTGGGETVKLEVHAVPGDVRTNVVSGGGFSSAVDATPGAHSSANNPTASSSDVMTTPAGEHYKVRGGKLCRQNSAGRWVPMRKAKRSYRGADGGRSHRLPPGGGYPWLPWAGGEEVGSLPTPH